MEVTTAAESKFTLELQSLRLFLEEKLGATKDRLEVFPPAMLDFEAADDSDLAGTRSSLPLSGTSNGQNCM